MVLHGLAEQSPLLRVTPHSRVTRTSTEGNAVWNPLRGSCCGLCCVAAFPDHSSRQVCQPKALLPESNAGPSDTPSQNPAQGPPALVEADAKYHLTEGWEESLRQAGLHNEHNTNAWIVTCRDEPCLMREKRASVHLHSLRKTYSLSPI